MTKLPHAAKLKSHIGTSLLSVIGGEVLLRAANFLAAAVIGRLFGITMFGEYAAVLAVVTVAERVADNGLEVTGIAEASSDLQSVDRILGSLYVVKTSLSAIAAGTLVLFGFVFRISPTIWILSGILGARVLLYSYCRLHTGIMKALDHMRPIGIIQLLHAVILYCGILGVYFAHSGLYLLLGILLAGQTLEFFASLTYLIKIGVRPRISNFVDYIAIARRATPIGITYTAASLGLRADVIIVSMLVSPIAMGRFAAADTGIVMVYVVAWLFGGVILSKMTPIAKEFDSLNRYTWKWVRLIISVIVPATVVASLLAPYMITLVFGGKFSPAGPLAAIMVWAAPFILLNAVFLSRSIARKASMEHVAIFVCSGLLSLVLDFALGRSFGAVGVSWAIVIREVLVSVSFFIWHKTGAMRVFASEMTEA